MREKWINASECATFLGIKPLKNGEPNRRYFLDHIASRPGFPAPLVVDAHRAWKFSEVEEWADDQRRITRAA